VLDHCFRGQFGAAAPDPEEQRRIEADRDRHRTDAIIATDRAKYGRRIADSPIERDLGPDRDLP
jgi:hypothetical protein